MKLDFPKGGIEFPADMKEKALAANALLHSGKGAGNDFLGWVHLPSSISAEEIRAIEAQAAKLRAKADVVVCIGIGGSYLGAKAVLEDLERQRRSDAGGGKNRGKGALSGADSPDMSSVSTAKGRKGAKGHPNSSDGAMQLSFFQLDDPVLKESRDQIRGLDINSLTPLEALNKLNEIKKLSGL